MPRFAPSRDSPISCARRSSAIMRFLPLQEVRPYLPEAKLGQNRIVEVPEAFLKVEGRDKATWHFIRNHAQNGT
jgi:hypothetical protein